MLDLFDQSVDELTHAGALRIDRAPYRVYQLVKGPQVERYVPTGMARRGTVILNSDHETLIDALARAVLLGRNQIPAWIEGRQRATLPWWAGGVKRRI